jgi:hypothetical protein
MMVFEFAMLSSANVAALVDRIALRNGNSRPGVAWS